MGICGNDFGIFDYIDFMIIAFEGRRKCFFVPYMGGLADFDSCWHQKLELHKEELLEIHNV
jgi:hypothetical protein